MQTEIANVSWLIRSFSNSACKGQGRCPCERSLAYIYANVGGWVVMKLGKKISQEDYASIASIQATSFPAPIIACDILFLANRLWLSKCKSLFFLRSYSCQVSTVTIRAFTTSAQRPGRLHHSFISIIEEFSRSVKSPSWKPFFCQAVLRSEPLLAGASSVSVHN